MQWTIDTAHTNVEFAVKHMAISTVRGRFKTFSGSIETDEQGRPTSVEATIDAASIDTGTPDRDQHLRSADFFDVANHPELTFRSTRVTPTASGYELEGDLTIRGVTRPVTLAVEVGSPVKDPWGNQRIAASATTTISRKEWGLTWNQVLEFGGVMVSDEVKITLDVEAIAAVPAAV